MLAVQLRNRREDSASNLQGVSKGEEEKPIVSVAQHVVAAQLRGTHHQRILFAEAPDIDLLVVAPRSQDAPTATADVQAVHGTAVGYPLTQLLRRSHRRTGGKNSFSLFPLVRCLLALPTVLFLSLKPQTELAENALCVS